MKGLSVSAYGLVVGCAIGLAAGCGSGGGDTSTTPIATRGTVSGTLFVPIENTVETEPNQTVAQAQAISTPQRVSGAAAQADPGFPVPGFPGEEVEDLYSLNAAGPVRITLTIVEDDPATNDLDLVLMDGAGTTVLDVSESLFSTELIETDGPGTFLIGVRAFAGASAYVLSVDPLRVFAGVATNIGSLGAEFVPGEVLVKFKSDAARDGQKALSLAARRGLTVARILPPGVAVLRAPVGPQSPGSGKLGSLFTFPRGQQNMLKAFTLDSVARLRTESDVEYAEPNFIRRALIAPNDSFYSFQWHYTLVNLPNAWDITTGDTDVIVAVLDTGVLSGHPDLRSRLVAGYDFVSSVANGDGDGRDANPEDAAAAGTGSHGTHVAGTIGAATNNASGVAGVTWLSRIMPLRVLGANGGTDADIAQAIRYAARLPNESGALPTEPARIINMSLGGPGFGQTVQDAINAARAQGVIVVAAAGNSNSSQPFYPASYNGVISVAAVDLEGQKTPYSNYGPGIDVAAPGGDMSVDLNGDGFGDGVLSTAGDGIGGFFSRFQQGTSMASPHVAGVIALMLATNPSLAPNDIDELLAGTHPSTTTRITRDIGAPGRDDVYGHGLIDAAQAVIAAQSVPGGPGPAPTGSILAISTDSLDFGSFLASLVFDVTNGGIGTLNITRVTDDASWLTVTPTSGVAPARLTAAIDRTGLSDGTYTATITVETDATQGATTATVSIRMRVSSLTGGNVGRVFVVVVDANTFATVDQAITGPANRYTFSTFGTTPGTYLVAAGTDRDDDGFICDVGEACGVYPEPVTIRAGQNTSGINFVVGDGASVQAAGRDVVGSRGKGFIRLR